MRRLSCSALMNMIALRAANTTIVRGRVRNSNVWRGRPASTWAGMSTTTSQRRHEPRRRCSGPFSASFGIARKKTPSRGSIQRLYGCSRSLIVAEVTKNLTMANNPACLFIDTGTPDGQATGLLRNSVVSCRVLVTVYADAIAGVLGTLSPSMKQKINDCLKTALAIT